jgi:hypothetical protein
MGNADTRVRVLDLYCRQITLTLYILLQSQDLYYSLIKYFNICRVKFRITALS